MCKHLKCSYAVIGLIIFFLGGTVSATGYKTTELNRKMAEISTLQHSLSERIALALTKKEQLKQKTESLKQEIRQEKEQMQIESYYKAVLIPRIDYNLKLIQLLLGYTTRLLEDTFWSGPGSAAGPGHDFLPRVSFILTESNTRVGFRLAK